MIAQAVAATGTSTAAAKSFRRAMSTRMAPQFWNCDDESSSSSSSSSSASSTSRRPRGFVRQLQGSWIKPDDLIYSLF